MSSCRGGSRKGRIRGKAAGARNDASSRGWTTAAAGGLIGATVATLVLTGTWSATRSNLFDGEIWRSGIAGAATITALVAAALLALWWRTQLVAPALWWSLAMAAVGLHTAVNFAAILAEPGSLPAAFEALNASGVVLAAFSTFKAVTSTRIDLTLSAWHVSSSAAAAFAVAGVLWWVAYVDMVVLVGWAAIAVTVLGYGFANRDTLAGWFGVGALGLLHFEIIELDSAPDAIVAVTGGLVLELALVLMLLGVFLHIEKGHSELEERLLAAYSRVDLLKTERTAYLRESENRDHEARSALAALENAAELMPAQVGSIPLRDAVHGEVALLRRLVTSGPTTLGYFRLADALVGSIAVQRIYGVDLNVSIPSLLEAFGDLSSTAEVARCLLENARSHAPGSPVDIDATRVGDEIHIVFADRGPGIAAADLHQIFDRGFTTGSGSGLGLAIAREMMESQGGQLTVDEKAELGARFVMSLPIRPPIVDGPNVFDDRRRIADGHRAPSSPLINDRSRGRRLIESDRDLGI